MLSAFYDMSINFCVDDFVSFYVRPWPPSILVSSLRLIHSTGVTLESYFTMLGIDLYEYVFIATNQRFGVSDSDLDGLEQETQAKNQTFEVAHQMLEERWIANIDALFRCAWALLPRTRADTCQDDCTSIPLYIVTSACRCG